MRAFGYVTNTAKQMLDFAYLAPGKTNRRVFYLGDEIMDYDLWADAFSHGLTGRRAKRIPIWLLSLLGRAGDILKVMGLRAPIDSGRVFRMSTSSKVDLSRTHAIVGNASVSFEQGVEKTLTWLEDLYSTTSRRRDH